MVGGQYARTARVGNDGQAVAGRALLQGQPLGAVKKLGDRFHPNDARPLERRLENGIIAGKGTGMRQGGLGAFLALSCLEHQDGFGAGKGPRRTHKPPGILQRFHINEDARRPGVISEIIDQVVKADIGHIPDGHKMAETDLLFARPIQNGRTQGAALR